MAATIYRVQLGARIIRTESPHAAAEASRAGARVTACTSDEKHSPD